MFQKILIVCTGNICRSPLAEAMLRQQLHIAHPASQAEVRSAGIGALVGAPADSTVQRIALEDGLALTDHIAQQATPALTRWADLVLVLEAHHLRYIVQLDPTARGKTFLLGHWTPEPEIDDPYRKSEERHRAVHARIAQAVRTWQDKL